MTVSDPGAAFGADYAAEQLRRSRHPLRRLAKRPYLDSLLRELHGATIDFGCGAGQLLARLPAGSIGLEINPHLIAALRARGLDAVAYDPAADGYALRSLPAGRYVSLVMAHVLEHLDDPAAALRAIFGGARRLGLERIVIVVPGAKGWRSDPTHRTFIDYAWLDRHGFRQCEGYALTRARHFPIDVARLGEYFTYHELQLIYDRVR